MTTNHLRKYIDILEGEHWDFGPNPNAPKKTEPEPAPASTTTAPPAAADNQAASPAPAPAPAPAKQPATASGEPDAKALQQALIDAGFDVGKHGVDGKIGPDTKAAIKAAEMTLGRTPTGQITIQELAGLKQAVANNGLTKALSAIEAVLAKYKIQAESQWHSVDQMVMENINLFTAQEQMEIWRILTEADTNDIPAYMRKGTDKFATQTPTKLGGAGGTAPAPAEKPRLKWDPATKNYYSTAANGSRVYQGGMTKAVEPTSKLAKFGKNLASRFGFEKGATGKAAARAGAKIAGKTALKFLPFVGWAWTAYDVGSALYDTYSQKDLGDLDPADQAIIKANLPTILQYVKDPKLADSLPDELGNRLRTVINGLTKLEVDLKGTA